MNRQITITIDGDTLLDMLSDRLDFWIPNSLSEEDKELFMQKYESYIDDGLFDGCKNFDVMDIVDNDVINYCRVYHKDELSKEDWQKLSRLYDDGGWDISCEDFEIGKFSFIEAKNNKAVLLRH